MLHHIRSTILNLLNKIYLFFQKDYKHTSSKQHHAILVAYLSAPFFKQKNESYMNAHQNRRETLLMASVFEDLGFSYCFTHFQKPFISQKGFDIVFGLEPSIDKAAKKNPHAIKIYYATGAYVDHQNDVIKARTDDFNKRTGSNVPYYRIVRKHNSSENADAIIQIGSQFTINSYPEHLKSKIITIRQMCHNFNFKNFMARKLVAVNRNEYIWMGSKGSILKGLDIVLDYFIEHQERTIHLIGDIDPEVMSYYAPKTSGLKNIIFHGFCNLDSPQLENIALDSAFVIMPSASEGCPPGSVINMMKLGCIPIVTDYSAFDEIEEYGRLINGYATDALHESITWFDQWNDQELKNRMTQCYIFANNNWNATNFKNDFKSALKSILDSHYCK